MKFVDNQKANVHQRNEKTPKKDGRRWKSSSGATTHHLVQVTAEKREANWESCTLAAHLMIDECFKTIRHSRINHDHYGKGPATFLLRCIQIAHGPMGVGCFLSTLNIHHRSYRSLNLPGPSLYLPLSRSCCISIFRATTPPQRWTTH